MNKGFTLIEILIVIVIVGIISTLIIINTDGSIEDAQVAVDKIDKAHDSAAEEKCKAFEKLYMIGFDSDSLYELDTDVAGRTPAKIIGTLFGIQENNPQSIASHNGKLYMIGSRRDALYVLDTEATRSPATRIGTRFGGQEGNPRSIASHNGKLYMIGNVSDSLYELDTEAKGKSPATIIGMSFGDQMDHPISITSHNGKLYMIGFDSASLYELDTEATGKSPATIVGESFGTYEDSPYSITSHNGKLYMVGSSSDSLYELDTEATGNPATKIGTSFGFPEDGSQGGRQEGVPRSITSHNGKLYMVGYDSNSLYELDTETTENPATIVGTRFREDFPISIASHCNI